MSVLDFMKELEETRINERRVRLEAMLEALALLEAKLGAKMKKIPREVEEEIYKLRAVTNSELVEVLKIDLLITDLKE